MNGYIRCAMQEQTGRRKWIPFILGTVVWAGFGSGVLLAQVPTPGVPGGAGQGGATGGGAGNPCVQATQLLAQQGAWRQRLDAVTEKIHTGVRQMDETLLRGLEAELNSIGREQEALEAASEACRNYVERLQVLSQCEQIPYLEEALSGASELIAASAELSINQSNVIPFVQNVQMMPGQMVQGMGGLPAGGMAPLNSMALEPNRQLGEVLQRLQEARAACAAEQSAIPQTTP